MKSAGPTWRFGVSPAYFISRYTDRFTPSQVAGALGEIREIGYDAVQLEVFHQDTLEEWERDGAELVASALATSGLSVSQFVAHFMVHSFESPAAIRSTKGCTEIEQLLRIVGRFPDCSLVTIPLGDFRFDEDGVLSTLEYSGLYRRFIEKLNRVVGSVEQQGLRCAIELIPGAFVSGTDGLANLFNELESQSVGYNFDTGHAHASKEPVPLIPFKLQGRVLGTHLCDNDSNENLSSRPGAGTIEWDQVFEALRLTGYQGGFDIEIRCTEDLVEQEYRQALGFIREATAHASNRPIESDQDQHTSGKEYIR